MNKILLNYIVQAILGGASGYITNDYAINMLFKEYTPLKLGGVIKKTRDEFIENISLMVENDIINKEKLHEIFDSQEFKAKFEKLTDDFYGECLYETAGSETFSDIEAFDSSLKKADKYVYDIINEHMESLLNLIADNFNIDYFITDLQAEKIADSLYKSIKDIFDNTKFIENSLMSFYENNKELKLAEIFGSQRIMTDELVGKFIEINRDAATSSGLIKRFDSAANGALDVFYGRQIKDIINLNDEIIDSLLSSAFDSQYIYKLCQSVYSYGASLNKSLYSLLDPAFDNKLRTYIEQNLPYLTEQAINYIQKNSLLIDRIIEDSVDEVINESEGLRAKLLHTIKNTYFNSLSEKYGIVDKIVAFIRQSAEPEKLSSNLSQKIIKSLDSLTLSDIVREAENNNFNADKAYTIVDAFINKNRILIGDSIKSYLSNLCLSDVLPKFHISAEKISASQTVQIFLKNRSRDYIEFVLSEELNDLLTEDRLKSYVNKLSSYIKLKFDEKDEPIKEFIADKISKISETDEISSLSKINKKTIGKEVLENKEVVNFIKRESFDKYKEEAAELKDLKLSLALDKLNSIEDISKNSSETLRKYLINNTDTILKGSIKNIVSTNLNKLSDDELVSFANDFIGRELKPLMFFGGVLGVIAGLILAVFQNTPLAPGDINIANMATYAFVGFITNVIAINMIFRPYREIKFLSKIPFFRNFSLGYIIRNQKNFAQGTANYIDKSLLSKQSINELFEKHKSSIKGSFTKNIAENDYAALVSLLSKNKKAAIGGTYNFLKTNISKNLNKFSNFLYGRLSQTKLSTILTHDNINNISHYAGEGLKNTENLSKSFYSAISSEKKLAAIIPADYLTDFLDNQGVKLYKKAEKSLAGGNFIAGILKYNDEYMQNSNKNIQEIFNLNDEKLAAASGKINEIILSQSFKEKLAVALISLFDKSLGSDKTVEELFDGKIKKYVDNKLPHIIENMTHEIENNLADNKQNISAAVRAELKGQLSLIEKAMYDLMGGDELVDQVINKIIIKKLPKFMEAKKDELSDMTAAVVNEKFYKVKAELLYAKFNDLQINALVDNYINTNKEKIEKITSTLTLELYGKIKNIELTKIIKLFKASDFNGLLNSFQAEINKFADLLHSNITADKNATIKELSSLNSFAAEKFMDLKFSDIFSQVSLDYIDEVLKNIGALLSKNDNGKEIIEYFLKIYKESNVDLAYYLDRDEFVISMEKFINALLKNDEFEKTIKQILYSVIDEAAENNFDFIDKGSKDYLIDVFVDSSIESLRKNLDEILKSVEFDRIASEEIEKMEPEKIHQMFNFFGEKYFRKLMLYGLGGFVFGINMYVGFALTGLKIISEIFKEDS